MKKKVNDNFKIKFHDVEEKIGKELIIFQCCHLWNQIGSTNMNMKNMEMQL